MVSLRLSSLLHRFPVPLNGLFFEDFVFFSKGGSKEDSLFNFCVRGEGERPVIINEGAEKVSNHPDSSSFHCLFVSFHIFCYHEEYDRNIFTI